MYISGKTSLAPLTGTFSKKWNVLKGSAKFATEISEWKMRLPYAILHRDLEDRTRSHLFEYNCGVFEKILNGQSEGNLPSGIFAAICTSIDQPVSRC